MVNHGSEKWICTYYLRTTVLYSDITSAAANSNLKLEIGNRCLFHSTYCVADRPNASEVRLRVKEEEPNKIKEEEEKEEEPRL